MDEIRLDRISVFLLLLQEGQEGLGVTVFDYLAVVFQKRCIRLQRGFTPRGLLLSQELFNSCFNLHQFENNPVRGILSSGLFRDNIYHLV